MHQSCCRLVVGLAVLPAVVLAQQPTFRSAVDVVTVDVSVSRRGEHVPDLDRRHFEVRDEGVRQQIDVVLRELVPIEAWLVLDVSGSVEGARLAQLRRAVDAFLGGLTARDRVGLITFAQQVEIRQNPTGNLDEVRRALQDIKASGKTALYDAALRAVGLRQRNDNRAVVVVLTDQHDNASETTPKQVFQAAERSDVIVYGVIADQSAGVGLIVGGRLAFGSAGGPQVQFQLGFLRSLAETTGGRVFRVSARLPLDEIFALVLDDARTRYVLTYRPSHPKPGWHSLKVKLVGVDGDVVARRGYYVAPTSAGRGGQRDFGTPGAPPRKSDQTRLPSRG